MSPSRIAIIVLSLCTFGGCQPAPPPAADKQSDAAATGENVPFRARVEFASGTTLPEDTRLAVYVVEANFEDGERRLVAERVLPAPEDSPVLVQLDVPRAELSPALGYEMHAAMVDGEGRLLMSATMNRAPVPATGLHFENTFRIRLLPVATPVEPEQIYRLAGALDFECAELAISVRQQADGSLIMNLRDDKVTLFPAVATAGGRFADGARELWITDDDRGFLMLPGEAPRSCTQR
jgi:uncharacterized lipoprotein YbaY